MGTGCLTKTCVFLEHLLYVTYIGNKAQTFIILSFQLLETGSHTIALAVFCSLDQVGLNSQKVSASFLLGSGIKGVGSPNPACQSILNGFLV